MTPLAPPFGSPRSGRKGFVPRTPILGTISDLVATAGDGAAVLTFTAPVGAFAYTPQHKESTSETWIDDADPEDLPADPGDAGFTVAGLTNGTAYDFRVLAHDATTTTTSNEDSATPTAGGGFGTVSNLASSAQGTTTLDYEWTQVEDDLGNPAKYAVRIRTPTLDESTWAEAFDTEILVDTNLAIGVSKTVQFTGLTQGTDYEAMLIPFRGEPGNADAFGDFSNSAAATTTGSSVLGTISDLSATAGDTQVALSWSPAENATSHQPQYKLTSSGTWLDFGSPLGAGASSVTVTGLTNDSSYDFRIEAGDGSTTTTSNVESATPTASEFNEPPGFTQELTWNGTQLVPSPWTEVGPNQPIKHKLFDDGTHPSGNANVYRHTYPGGLQDGRGTEFIVAQIGSAFEYSEMYFRLNMRFTSSAGADQFFTHPAAQKLIYFGGETNGTARGVNFYIATNGTGQRITFRLQNDVQGGNRTANRVWAASDPDNAASPPGSADNLEDDTWYRVEVWGRSNTGAGNADGALKLWVDGVLVMDFDANYPEAANRLGTWDYEFHERDGWYSIRTDSIFGGNTGVTVPNEQYIDFDDLYVSGKP